MAQLNNKSTIVKIMIFMIGLMGIVITSVYPTSHSRFIDENTNALVYATKLYTLFKGKVVLNANATSTYKLMKSTFTLERNNIATSTEKDMYFLEVPSICTISGLNATSLANGNKRYSYRFSGMEEKKDFNLSCNVAVVDSDINPFHVIFSVYEQIADEQEFLYKQYEYNNSNYYNFRPIPEIETTLTDLRMTKDSRKKMKTFTSWISNYVLDYVTNLLGDSATDDEIEEKHLEYFSSVMNYVETVYATDADFIKNPALVPPKGITMNYDATSGTYHFHLESNLIGYARTAEMLRPNYMIFSSTNSKDLDEAFRYYLAKAYPNENDQKTIIEYLDYYSGGKGIAYLVLPNEYDDYNILSGFTKYSPTYQRLTLDARLLEYANSHKNHYVQVAYRDNVSLMKSSFEVSLEHVYGNILPEKLKLQLMENDNPIRNAMLVTYSKGFNQTFLEYDDVTKQYFYITVSSPEDENFNYMEIQILSVPNNMTIELLENGSMKVFVTNATVTELASFVNQLVVTSPVVVTGPVGAETSIVIEGAEYESLLDIMQQLNDYLEALKQKQDAIVKEDEDIPADSSQQEIKE